MNKFFNFNKTSLLWLLIGINIVILLINIYYYTGIVIDTQNFVSLFDYKTTSDHSYYLNEFYSKPHVNYPSPLMKNEFLSENFTVKCLNENLTVKHSNKETEYLSEHIDIVFYSKYAYMLSDIIDTNNNIIAILKNS